MLPDYHMHTPLCNHARGEPEEYARRALERGIPEIGFSDHAPMPPTYDPEWRMKRAEYGRYVEMVSRCRAAVPDLSIKLALEGDYFPGTEDYVRESLGEFEFDYVIGSVHYLGDWGFDNEREVHRFGERDIFEVYEEYYLRLGELAETGLFDIVGHPDVVKKFGHRPSKDTSEIEQRALDRIAKAGMALDVNTSGLRRPAREIYPSRRILEAAKARGIGITFGSDAHEPGHVGESFAEALAHVKAAGYTHSRRYTRRRFEEIPLP